jgi:hypothetical protein
MCHEVVAISHNTDRTQWFSKAPISQIVLKNFIIISLIIKECHEDILIKLAIVLKISKSSWNTEDLFAIQRDGLE